MHHLSVAASWLSVGSSYQEPLVAINTETEIKTVSLKANKNEYPNYSDLGSNNTVNLVSDNQENREKDYFQKDDKSGKKRKKDHRADKKEKKKKNKKSRRNENDHEDVGNDKKSNKNKKEEVDKNRKMTSDKRVKKIDYDLINSNFNEDLYTGDNQNNKNDDDDANMDVESDSDTDWSSDDSITSVHMNTSNSTSTPNTHSTPSSTIKKSKKKNNNNHNNNSNNQLVISNKNDIQETRDLIFLPDGKILLTEVKKISGTGVSWVTDIRGDKSIKLHGVYTPDIPVYSLYTGSVDLKYKSDRKNVLCDNTQIDNYTYSSEKSYSSSKNNKYLNSISLAKRTHTLPTGLIMSSENGPIFRPKEKTVLQHKFGKMEILREIRLKKKNRFYLAGKNQMIINSEGIEGSMKKKKVTVDAISDINLKRIRFENFKKRKNQLNTPNEKEIKTANDINNELEMHFNTSGNLIIEKSNTKNRTLIPYSASNFLTSDFLPLPTHTISGIDTEFVNEDTDFKSVKTAETKRDHAAFFGFGNNSEYENLKNEIEVKVLEKKKEIVKVFLSDSEVTISINILLDFLINAFLVIIFIIVIIIITIIIIIELITTINILFILM